MCAQAELDRMTKKFEEITFSDKPSREEEALAALLAKLIEDYEDKHYPVPAASPRDTLLFLMDQHGLRQADLLDVFGSRSVASDVVNGKRSISKAQAKKLAERFRVSADVFI